MTYALPITLLAALAVSLALNAWIAGKLAAARIEAEDTAEERVILKSRIANLLHEATQLAGTVNWMRRDVDELAAIKVARRKSAKNASDASAAKRANGGAAAPRVG